MSNRTQTAFVLGVVLAWCTTALLLLASCEPTDAPAPVCEEAAAPAEPTAGGNDPCCLVVSVSQVEGLCMCSGVAVESFYCLQCQDLLTCVEPEDLACVDDGGT